MPTSYDVNDELMLALGFVKTDTAWVDDYMRIKFEHLPADLKGLKRLIGGIAFNKGLRSANLTQDDQPEYIPRSRDY